MAPGRLARLALFAVAAAGCATPGRPPRGEDSQVANGTKSPPRTDVLIELKEINHPQGRDYDFRLKQDGEAALTTLMGTKTWTISSAHRQRAIAMLRDGGFSSMSVDYTRPWEARDGEAVFITLVQPPTAHTVVASEGAPGSEAVFALLTQQRAFLGIDAAWEQLADARSPAITSGSRPAAGAGAVPLIKIISRPHMNIHRSFDFALWSDGTAVLLTFLHKQCFSWHVESSTSDRAMQAMRDAGFEQLGDGYADDTTSGGVTLALLVDGRLRPVYGGCTASPESFWSMLKDLETTLGIEEILAREYQRRLDDIQRANRAVMSHP